MQMFLRRNAASMGNACRIRAVIDQLFYKRCSWRRRRNIDHADGTFAEPENKFNPIYRGICDGCCIWHAFAAAERYGQENGNAVCTIFTDYICGDDRIMKKRGSYTIEAALLMPLILGSIVFIIYAAYYTHDRAVLQKCAYIAALRGSQIRIGDGETCTIAKENSSQLIQGKLLGSWELTDIAETEQDRVRVVYEGYMQIPKGVLMNLLQQGHWHVRKEAVAMRIDEPVYIRSCRQQNNR